MKKIEKNLPQISSVKKINWQNLDLIFLSMPNGEAQKLIMKNYDKNKSFKLLIPFEMSIDKIVKDIEGVNRG